MEGDLDQGKVESMAVSVSDKREPSTGRFVKGQSGNPNGRPPSIRAKIGLNQTLMEDFVRGKVPAKDVLKVVQQTFRDALSPNPKIHAANRKLVFNFFIQKPRDVEAVEDKGNSVVIRIENATFKAQHSDPSIIEGEVTQISDEEIKQTEVTDNG
jgi:uncharacterized protein (DUF2267 family)